MTQLNTDNEFGCIEDDILPTHLNMVAENEYVGDVKVSIKTTKECCRCHVYRKPYEWYTQIMVAGCIAKSTLDLNDLPTEDGISKDMSPATLIIGRQRADFVKVNKLSFCDYVQAHRCEGATNTRKAKTMGAIALYPSENQ